MSADHKAIAMETITDFINDTYSKAQRSDDVFAMQLAEIQMTTARILLGKMVRRFNGEIDQ